VARAGARAVNGANAALGALDAPNAAFAHRDGRRRVRPA
jgi:hypothetical protein